MFMKKSILISAVAIVTLCSGCSLFNKPRLYGNDSCGAGKTAYVYASGNAAICLNEASVAYMICARELGILTAESTGTIKGNVEADVLQKGNASAGGEADQTVKVTYADTGPLADATARAIHTCIEIHNNYR